MAVVTPRPRATEPGTRRWTVDEFRAMRELGFFDGIGAALIDDVVCVNVLSDPHPLPWNRHQYHAMGDRGFFQGQRVELIGGEVVVLSPQSPRHFGTLERIAMVLRGVFAGDWVRTQGPLKLGPWSEPEPDVSVVEGPLERYLDGHPTSARLVVEVSQTTLSYDRLEKLSLYAQAGIPDDWLVNLVARQVEVYRDPIADPAQPFGARYSSRTVVKAGQSLAPLAAADRPIPVEALLP